MKNSIIHIKNFPFRNQSTYAFVDEVYSTNISLTYLRDKYYVSSNYSLNFFKEIEIIKENCTLDDLKDLNSSLIFQ